MNHREAVERHAVDRYVIGDMSPSELSEFEEHFFECPECAAEIEAGSIFAANARAVLTGSGYRERERRGLRWLRPSYLVAAAAVLLLIVCYRELVSIPRLRAELERATGPQAYPAFFLRPVARGDDQVIAIPKSAPFVGLSLDIPPGGHWTVYECSVSAASPPGPAFEILAPAPAVPGSPINVLIPASRLTSGSYTLILRGKTGAEGPAELGRFCFIVQFN
jgi:hypothetical protein